MGLQLESLVFYGIHGPIVQRAPELQVARTKYFGVAGISEILGYGGGREMQCESWLHDATLDTQAKLVSYLDTLDRQVGTHGALQAAAPGAVTRTFNHVTFQGFEMGEWGILPDETGSLAGGFWCKGILHFFQLSTVDDA